VGEQAIEELLELAYRQGCGDIHIIPDRNWNVPDPDARQMKVQNLYRVVESGSENGPAVKHRN